MNELTGHGRAKYITGIRLGTREGRGWQGLLAERRQHSEGDLAEIQPRDTESVVMLQGRLRIPRRGDGRLQHHDAVPGMVWLCPAGIREDMIHLYGEVEESIHLYFPASPLLETALQKFDVDPDKVRLRYDGGFRGPLVEYVAREVHAETMDEAPLGRMQVENLAKALGVYIMRHYSNLDSGLDHAAGGTRRLHLRVLVPGPPDTVVQANRRHHPGSVSCIDRVACRCITPPRCCAPEPNRIRQP